MTPDHVGTVTQARSQRLKIWLKVAVEVAGEQEARVLEVITVALVRALVYDVVDYHPTGEMSAVDAGQWALFPAL
jgi:hypothetical protein